MAFYVTRKEKDAEKHFEWVKEENLSINVLGDTTPIEQLCEHIGAGWNVDPSCVDFEIRNVENTLLMTLHDGKRKMVNELPPAENDMGYFITVTLTTSSWATRALQFIDVVKDDKGLCRIRRDGDIMRCWSCRAVIKDLPNCLVPLCGHTHCASCADEMKRKGQTSLCRYCQLPTFEVGERFLISRGNHALTRLRDSRKCIGCSVSATQQCWCEALLCDRHVDAHCSQLQGHTTASIMDSTLAEPFAKPSCVAPVCSRHDGGLNGFLRGRLQYYCTDRGEAMCSHCACGSRHADCKPGCHVSMDDASAVAHRTTLARAKWTDATLLLDDEAISLQDDGTTELSKLMRYRDRLQRTSATLVAYVCHGLLEETYPATPPAPPPPAAPTAAAVPEDSAAAVAPEVPPQPLPPPQKTPLRYCCGAAPEDTDHKVCMELIASLGLNPNEAFGDAKWTAMHSAAFHGHASCIAWLRDIGGDINVEDAVKDTPIHIAARQGRGQSITALSAAGALVNARNGDGHSPVYVAALNSKPESVLALGLANADLNLTNAKGWSPLYAAAYAGKPESIQALLDAGADVMKLDSTCRTPVHAAAIGGKPESIPPLVNKCKVSLSKVDKDGLTPMHFAAGYGFSDVVRKLVELGARTDVHVKDKIGRTPLKMATAAGKKDCVALLTELERTVPSHP